MRLTNEKIYNIVEETVGKEAIPIVEYLKDRKNISDFKIAEKTAMDMQTVRNLLYQLHGHNIVSYIRRKDRIKGWYISYFTFNRKGVKDLIERVRRQKLDHYKERLKAEQEGSLFFICPNMCVRLNLDEATNFDFHCPECGSVLNQQDNQKTIARLKEKIKELEVCC